jgi:hypothetical protein
MAPAFIYASKYKDRTIQIIQTITTVVAEHKHSTSLIPKPVTGHDPEPFSFMHSKFKSKYITT